MKKLVAALLVSTLPLSVCAEQICDDSGRCTTAGAGAAAATGSGIYSARKYSQANSIEKEFTKTVFNSAVNNQGANEVSSINRIAGSFKDGDKVSIQFQYGEFENRAYHIDLMEENASSARSMATMHLTMSMSAMTTETDTYTDGNGQVQTTTRMVPDHAARAAHALMAINAEREAAEYTAKANDARRGGPVPTYTLDHVIEDDKGTAKLTQEFAKERINKGGRIFNIANLPHEKFVLVKSAIGRGRAGLAGVALGAGIAVEEMISGQAARMIESRQYAPNMVRDWSQSVR